MKRTTTVLLGGTTNTFRCLSQELTAGGYNVIEVSSNPLEIQFEAITSKPSAIFLNSVTENIMVLIKNLKKLKKAPAVYIIQSPYEIIKNSNLEKLVNAYFCNPIDINNILSSLKQDITELQKIYTNRSTFEIQLHNVISDTLNRLCVTPNYNGYMYLREAIKMAVTEPINSRGFSTKIYPTIALNFGVTSASIERNIRTAIMKSWQKAPLFDKTEIFGAFSANSSWHPTNGEFILIIADKISRDFSGELKAVNL